MTIPTAIPITGAEAVTWDLTELFQSPDDPAIESLLAEIGQWARAFEAKYRGHVADLGPADFAAMMSELEDIHDAASRPGLYAALLHTQDTADPARGRLVARVTDAEAEVSAHLVFHDLELAQLTDEAAERLAADGATARYAHTISRARLERPHQLPEPEERLLAELSPVGTGAWVRLFEELTAGVKVPFEGADVSIDQALATLRDADRSRRKAAADAVTAALEDGMRTRGYILNVVLQEHAIQDRLRGYPTWVSARNLSNQTDDAAVEALVEAVTGRYPLVSRYYEVKRRLLGLDALHEWDRYAPVGGATREIDWTGARDLVLGAYRDFSPRAGSIVAEFFEKPWIDAVAGGNKRGGAFCAGASPRLHPFVMMNFTGRLNDALTLAHELGHALHDRLAERQHIFDYHPPLTLAETASTFGEALTFERIMATEKDPGIRLGLLCSQVEDGFATVFRQVSMNRFENAIHVARRAEGELSMEQLGDHWQHAIQSMFGNSVELTAGHRGWWSYVGHFYFAPGYVYAYAYGNLLAMAVYRRYRESGPEFVESYLEFLAAGGSARPDDLVRTLGMDLRDPAFWDSGLAILAEQVSEVEDLATQLGR